MDAVTGSIQGGARVTVFYKRDDVIEAIVDGGPREARYPEWYLWKLKRIKPVKLGHGEWLKDTNTFLGINRYNRICSNCGQIGGAWEDWTPDDHVPGFCQWCGSYNKK